MISVGEVFYCMDWPDAISEKNICTHAKVYNLNSKKKKPEKKCRSCHYRKWKINENE